MAGHVPDEAFARYLNQIGLVTLEKIDAAKAVQSERGQRGILVPLADVFVQQGVITAEQRENVLKKLAAQQAGGIKQLGQYKLLKKLGEGGMGAVYLAEDLHVARKVAVKVLPKKYADDREFLTRFRREAQITGKLNHVNIVGAYSFGEEMGMHYYAMEYCDGEPLDKTLKREKTISWDDATGVVLQIARGLKHAHDSGIIHRDIKPANIFICRPLGTDSNAPPPELFPKGFVAKILDLGLSKNVSGSEQSFTTQTGVALGTPHYISPEQARGDKQIDGRCDIYSLGATYYHLVTGQTPFEGSTGAAVMLKHLNDELPNPQDVNETVPDGVAHVIMRMMAKQPADRYRDCNELLADLERIIVGHAPASAAVEAGKSSVAIARKRRLPDLAAMRARQAAAVHHAAPPAAAKKPGHQPVVAPAAMNRKPLYIAGGVLALGALIFVVALAGGGRGTPGARLNSETCGTQPGRIAANGGETKTAPVTPEKKEPAATLPPLPLNAPASDDPRENYAQHLLDAVKVGEKQGALAGAALRQRLSEIARNHNATKAGKEAAERLKALPTPEVLLDAWAKSIQTLPPAEQVQAVMQKLKVFNPGFDPEWRKVKESIAKDPAGPKFQTDFSFKTEGGKVIQLRFQAAEIADVSPLSALTGLTQLDCNVGWGHGGALSLSGLKGLLLSELNFANTYVKDLEPLRGMPLTRLTARCCPGIHDLSPLAGMRLTELRLGGSDNIDGASVSDLSPLKGLPLTELDLRRCVKVQDLSPLAGMPLRWLHCGQTQVTDLAPLQNMPLELFWCNPDLAMAPANRQLLSKLNSLKKINNLPVAEFWKKYPEAGTPEARAGSDEHPLKRAKVGDWVEYVMQTKVGAKAGGGFSVMRQTVAKKTDTAAVVETLMKSDTSEVKNQTPMIDLTQKYYQSPLPGCVAPGPNTKELASGTEVLTLAGRSLNTTWVLREAKAGDRIIKSKQWMAPDVPVGGIVKAENSMGEIAFSFELKDCGFGGAETAATAPTQPAASSLPKELTLNLSSTMKMFLVRVPAGELMMGSNDGGADEKPVHRVKISQPFYISKFELTVAQFRTFVDASKYVTEAERTNGAVTVRDGKWQWVAGTNWRKPGFAQSDSHPVCAITWNDAQEFCKWATNATRRKVRLPTEAEWEYAARGPDGRIYPWGDKWEGTPANVADASLRKMGFTMPWGGISENDGMPFTAVVGTFKMTSWCGAIDMAGNVWEWCEDRYNSQYYSASPPLDPPGPDGGTARVIRGGSWCDGPARCRAAGRNNTGASQRDALIGFRPVLAEPVRIP